MGRHKKVLDTPIDYEEEHPFFLCCKSTMRQLTGEFYGNVSGNNYDESVRLSIEWSERVNNDKKSPYRVSLCDYYRQEYPEKKSIVFTYNKIFKEDIPVDDLSPK